MNVALVKLLLSIGQFGGDCTTHTHTEKTIPGRQFAVYPLGNVDRTETEKIV